MQSLKGKRALVTPTVQRNTYILEESTRKLKDSKS